MRVERLFFVVSIFLYVAVMYSSYVSYLNPVWGYYGFTYFEPELEEVAMVMSLILLTSLFLPFRMRTPGALVVIFLHSVVYIPGVIVCMCVAQSGAFKYGYILCSLTVVFILISLVARHGNVSGFDFNMLECSTLGRKVIFGIWFFLGVVLIFEYHSSLSFVGLDNVYDQRAETSTVGGYISYFKTYFAYVLTPIIFSLGLSEKRGAYMLLAVGGFVLMYMISAERTIFLMPFLTLAFNMLLKGENGIGRSATLIYLGLSLLVAFTSVFFATNTLANVLGIYFLFRTLALPGLSISLYEDLFNKYGYTHWAHVKGVSAFVDAPAYFVSDEAWPQLGVLVGKYMYGTDKNNYNANLFSGDGVAAAGALGVLFIGVFLSVWIYLLNRLSVRWSTRFSMLVVLPLAVILTNGHFFTALISFGGLFLLLFFYFFSAEKRQKV